MNCISKLQSHRFLFRKCLLQPSQTRTIFDESYLSQEGIQSKQKEFLASCNDVKAHFENIQRNFQRGGIEVMTQNQVFDTISSASENEDCNDKEYIKTIVKSFCQDIDRDEKAKQMVIKSFLYLCYINQDHENATEIADLGLSMNLMGYSTTSIYLQLLYNAGLYENVYTVIKMNKDELFPENSTANLNTYTRALAALYQLGTDEAFRDAMELKKEMLQESRSYVERFKREKKLKTNKNGTHRDFGFFRGSSLAGWFAVEKGKYGIAIDFFENMEIGKSDLNLNIMCYAKAKSGDAEGAIKEMSSVVRKSKGRWKVEVCSEVMDAISEEVKYFSSPDLNEQFSKLCSLLDKGATLTETSIREEILRPITSKPERKKDTAFSAYKKPPTDSEKVDDLLS